MAPRLTEEPKGVSVQPRYMLKSGCNHGLVWDINIPVVFPALQQDLRQLRLVRFPELEVMKLRLSHIFNTSKMPLRMFHAQKHLLHEKHRSCFPVSYVFKWSASTWLQVAALANL